MSRYKLDGTFVGSPEFEKRKYVRLLEVVRRKHNIAMALTLSCPHCGARPEQRCIGKKGGPMPTSHTHQSRLTKAEYFDVSV